MFDRKISIVVRSISETSDVAMIFYAVSEFYYYAFISRLTTDKGEVKRNSRKSVRWSAVPVPCLSRLWLKLRGEQGSGPEGVDDLCFHTYGGFSPPSPSSLSPPSNPGLETQNPVSRPKSHV